MVDNTPPNISFISPKKAQIIKGSNEFKIEWSGSDNLGIDSYSLSFSRDGGKTWKNIVDLNGTFNHFNWNVPDLLTNDCFLKLYAKDFKKLSKMALSDPSTAGNPIKLNLEDFYQLYKNSYEGNLDF